MTIDEAKEFYQFVTRTLPNLLGEAKDPFEAMDKLSAKWKETRTENITDRSDEVEANREEVDSRLEQRRRSKKKKRASSDE